MWHKKLKINNCNNNQHLKETQTYQVVEKHSKSISSNYMMKEMNNLTLEARYQDNNILDSHMSNALEPSDTSPSTHLTINLTETNETLLVNNEFRMIGYPSGYTTAEVYVISIATVLIMAAIIVGNLLVLIAIFFEYSLQCVQNWFVASLALADLAIGVLIMPFSLSQEVVGYWLFGEIWCQIHQALDVLLSTASILNITLISLDRYWSITNAIKVNFFRVYSSNSNWLIICHDIYRNIHYSLLLFLVHCVSNWKICNDNDLCCVVFKCPGFFTNTSLPSLEDTIQKAIQHKNLLTRTRQNIS